MGSDTTNVTTQSKSCPASTTTNPPKPHHHSIRAHFDLDTITLYQAYSSTIATAAVQSQSLRASPLFSPTRTTWLKPSWNWMMYRSGYSYKDINQSHILTLSIKHEHFEELLSHARIAGEKWEEGKEVVVQWDPERSVRIGRLEYRSIQIGVPGSMVGKLVDEWIVRIEDVTDRARRLKERLGGENEGKKVSDEVLVDEGLVPIEKVYDHMLSVEVRKRLRMHVSEDEEEVLMEDGVKSRSRKQKRRN